MIMDSVLGVVFEIFKTHQLDSPLAAPEGFFEVFCIGGDQDEKGKIKRRRRRRISHDRERRKKERKKETEQLHARLDIH